MSLVNKRSFYPKNLLRRCHSESVVSEVAVLTYVQLLIHFSLVRSTPKDQADWNSIQVIEHCLDGVSNPKSRGSDT